MGFDFEHYIARLPKQEGQLLRKQVKHSVSCYALTGDHLSGSFEQENLLAVLISMKRFVVDSNSPWKREAAKPENFDKAFVVGETAMDEPDNLKGVLFSRLIDTSNNNLFSFGQNNLGTVPFYEISRFDEHHRAIFDEKRLDEESKPRAGRTDAEFVQREMENMAAVDDLRRFILSGLELARLTRLPAPSLTEPKRLRLLEMIRKLAPLCPHSFWNSIRVATFCYAVLLLERDDIGGKTRREFNDLTNRNVFGDTRLLQNALWLNSHILSSDRAVKRMTEYINLSDVTTTDRIVNPLPRILWFRLAKWVRSAGCRLTLARSFSRTGGRMVRTC